MKVVINSAKMINFDIMKFKIIFDKVGEMQ